MPMAKPSAGGPFDPATRAFSWVLTATDQIAPALYTRLLFYMRPDWTKVTPSECNKKLGKAFDLARAKWPHLMGKVVGQPGGLKELQAITSIQEGSPSAMHVAFSSREVPHTRTGPSFIKVLESGDQLSPGLAYEFTLTAGNANHGSGKAPAMDIPAVTLKTNYLMGEDESPTGMILGFAFHHTVMDGPSIGHFLRRFALEARAPISIHNTDSLYSQPTLYNLRRLEGADFEKNLARFMHMSPVYAAIVDRRVNSLRRVGLKGNLGNGMQKDVAVSPLPAMSASSQESTPLSDQIPLIEPGQPQSMVRRVSHSLRPKPIENKLRKQPPMSTQRHHGTSRNSNGSSRQYIARHERPPPPIVNDKAPQPPPTNESVVLKIQHADVFRVFDLVREQLPKGHSNPSLPSSMCGLLWVAVTQARNMGPARAGSRTDTPLARSACSILVDPRSVIQREDYFGNLIVPTVATSTAAELVDGIRQKNLWAAVAVAANRIQKAVDLVDESMVANRLQLAERSSPNRADGYDLEAAYARAVDTDRTGFQFTDWANLLPVDGFDLGPVMGKELAVRKTLTTTTGPGTCILLPKRGGTTRAPETPAPWEFQLVLKPGEMQNLLGDDGILFGHEDLAVTFRALKTHL